jgi:hypothetical protein
MGTSGGDSTSTETVDKKTGGGSPAPASAATGVAAHRPAETLTALAGGLGAAVTQLLDVENAAVISALIALVGFLPALITWLVEVGKKWDGPGFVPPRAEVAAELDYAQARLLRHARIAVKENVGGAPESELERVKAIRDAFGETKPESGA